MNGLEATFKALSLSKSDAAEELWLESLASPRSYIRSQAFQAAGQGAPTPIQVAIISQWRDLAPEEKQLIGHHLVRFLPGLRACLGDSDDTRRANAYAIALAHQAYALIPDFVHVIEVTNSSFRASAGRILIRLADMMSRECQLAADSSKSITADFYRPQSVECLTKSMRRFHQHQRIEILGAFLLVAPLDSPILTELLDQPQAAPLVSAAEHLAERRYVDVPDRLLVEYLHTNQPPELIQQLWSSRKDTTFLRAFLGEINQSVDRVCHENIANIKRLDWLQNFDDWVADLEIEQQRGLVKLACTAALEASATRNVLLALIHYGHEALIASCVKALQDDDASIVDEQILQLVHHHLWQVQVEVIRQLRSRHVPGGEAILIQALDHENPNVRKAACDSFADYTVDSFLTVYDSMEEDQRSDYGYIVKRVDPQLIPKLHNELTQEVRFRKLRALEIVNELELFDLIEDDLLALAECADQGLRIEACNALGSCSSADAEIALNRALTDKSIAVKEAALQSLQRIERHRSSNHVDSSPLASCLSATSEAAP